MRKVHVHYEGWGENWLLGTLADSGQKILFEYSEEALRQGLELSPRHLPLQATAFGQFPDYLDRLPGLISDALPDGWGMLLMNRLFRKQGLLKQHISPLARLSFIGTRSMGALTFHPEVDPEMAAHWVDLRALAAEAQVVLADDDSAALKELAILGGSPHGARPKVLLHWDRAAHRLGSQSTPDSQPWLLKFQAKGEHKEVCQIEQVYSQLAAQCGLNMPATHYFDLGPDLAAFGIERFDVERGMRVPIHTLAGLMHANFRVPQVDYVTFLRATRFLTKDIREVWRAFERAVFNVVFNNRDDHSKNFSFRLGQDRQWKLAPCYDLTFCEGPGGEHFMDVCGEGRSITRAHLLKLAEQADLERAGAVEIVDRVLAVADQLPALLQNAEVRGSTAKHIKMLVDVNRRNLR